MPTFEELIRLIAEQEMPEDQHCLIETFQDSTHFWANTNLSMMRKWVIDTDMMLDKDLANTDVRLFYINLHGIVEDMYSHHNDRIETLKEVFKVVDLPQLSKAILGLTGNEGMKIYLNLSVKIFEELQEIRNEFSDFELKQIMFFRHRYCHPLLTKLSIKIDKKKRFTRVEIDALMRKIAATDELDAMEAFHAKLFGKHNVVKRLNEILRTMQFA